MKYFNIYRPLLKDNKNMELFITHFAIQNRIPKPWDVKIYLYHADNFVKNEATVLISSLAIIKTNETN